jgi:hypothetical protein
LDKQLLGSNVLSGREDINFILLDRQLEVEITQSLNLFVSYSLQSLSLISSLIPLLELVNEDLLGEICDDTVAKDDNQCPVAEISRDQNKLELIESNESITYIEGILDPLNFVENDKEEGKEEVRDEEEHEGPVSVDWLAERMTDAEGD